MHPSIFPQIRHARWKAQRSRTNLCRASDAGSDMDFSIDVKMNWRLRSSEKATSTTKPYGEPLPLHLLRDRSHFMNNPASLLLEALAPTRHRWP